MIILGKTPKDWQKEIGSKSLYYRTEIVIFIIGFIFNLKAELIMALLSSFKDNMHTDMVIFIKAF